MNKSFLLLLFVLMSAGCERITDINEDGPLPPAVPASLRVYSARDAEIIIEWTLNSDPNVSLYNIYRSIDSINFIKHDSAVYDYYYDDSLDYYTTYYYRISAVNKKGTESGLTEPVSARPENRRPPGVPRFPEINARNWENEKSVFLSWYSNEESDIAGYNIYRGIESGFTPDSSNLTGSSVTPFFSDTSGLELYTGYYYKIKAFDKGGLISNESAEVTDYILGIPEPLFPPPDTSLADLIHFKFQSLPVPAEYRILVQTNSYYGEIWSASVTGDGSGEIITVSFDKRNLPFYGTYYWRILTYSGNIGPNSISSLYKFNFVQ